MLLSSRSPGPVLSALLVVGVCFAGALGCYAPKIDNGKLQCSIPDRLCPDGMECSAVDRFCYKKGEVPVVTVRPLDSGAPDAIAMCQTMTPAGGKCDPVCQVGCNAEQKCNVTATSTGCTPAPTTTTALGVNATCTPGGADQCARGLICLREPRPVCGAHCYKYCRSDSDCQPPALGMPNSGSRCTGLVDPRSTLTSTKVCSPPRDDCDPSFGLGQLAPRCTSQGGPRPFPTFGCYVLSTDYPDIPVCDCAGFLTEEDTTPTPMRPDPPGCSGDRTCVPGFDCVPNSAGPTAKPVTVCRRVCKLAGGAPCPPAQTCTSFMSNMRPPSRIYGYCK